MGMVWRKRGIGSFISYTDKWTALSEPTIGSSFPRTERVETKPCGRGFPDADLSREMQESRHYCRDSRVNQIKAALFLARARVIDLHRLLFLAALIFVPFKGHMVVVDDLHYFADLLFHSRNRFELRSVSERFGGRIVIAL